MKYYKRYLIFAAVVIAAAFLKFHIPESGLVQIVKQGDVPMETDIWNPLIASDVNSRELKVQIGGREFTNQETGAYMDENLNLMVPAGILQESFDCAAHVYNNNRLVLEKQNDVLEFSLGEASIQINDEKEELSSPMTEQNGEYFVPLAEISEGFHYGLEWDVHKNAASAIQKEPEGDHLPSSYDLRERGRTSAVRNQGPFGTCWAAAALTAIESSILPEENSYFSVDHMSMNNSFSVDQYDGGDYTMAMAYLTAWQGPVLEKDDPYGDGVSDSSLTAVKHIQEIQIIEDKDYQAIKDAVFKYGGVQTSVYSTLTNSRSNTPYYNRDTRSYCYIGEEKPNHDVVIIGWDDSYPKDNFNGEPEGDGAFICQNSWGENFADHGVFYVSYYDSNIGLHNIVYTSIENADNYDAVYQSDLCGWAGQIGYSHESIYGANVYTAKTAENLEAAGFYAVGKNTEYTLYVVKNFEDRHSFADKVQVASGTLSAPGYYTVKFQKDIALEAGEDFAVVLYISTPGQVHPLAVEYRADDKTAGVILDDGRGYISARGNNWESVEETQNCNVCLKAYTKQR
ncbi:MAG: cell surface protein [Eubacterium sp.]|nr:cell surface protein [Eubacterium sp.]